MSDLVLTHKRADQDWRGGKLVRARAGYAALVAAAPGLWSPRFQLAWIDASFAPPSPATLAELSRADLPQDAAERLAMLARRTSDFLVGDVGAWDLDVLRAQASGVATWWTSRAALADAAGAWGLADCCWNLASQLDDDLLTNPPPEATRLVRVIADHLAAVRSGDDRSR